MSTLRERINDYLQTRAPCSRMQVAEGDYAEYLMRRAETDLQAERERRRQQELESEESPPEA